MITQQVVAITTLPVAIESVVMKFTSIVVGITRILLLSVSGFQKSSAISSEALMFLSTSQQFGTVFP